MGKSTALFSRVTGATMITVLFAFVTTTTADFVAPVAVAVASNNYSQPILGRSDPVNLFSLRERQSNCYSPNKYCSRYGYCCSSSAGGCCSGGCAAADISECCLNGDYCTIGNECCNSGCMPAGAECCRSGGYCPQPFRCVIYNGDPGCCTDLTCSVYYSSGATVTATTSRRPATTQRPTTTPELTTARTSRTTSDFVPSRTAYTTYSTTIYWYYWYYYYTISYSPSTYTTRVRTTTTLTTTVTTVAADSAEARSVFSDISSDLPTPTDAEITIPPTPTAGAIILGSCTSTGISTSIGSDGSRNSRTVTYCQSITAGSNGGGSGSGGGSNGNPPMNSAPGTSYVHQSTWLVLVSVMLGTLATAILL